MRVNLTLWGCAFFCIWQIGVWQIGIWRTGSYGKSTMANWHMAKRHMAKCRIPILWTLTVTTMTYPRFHILVWDPFNLQAGFNAQNMAAFGPAPTLLGMQPFAMH